MVLQYSNQETSVTIGESVRDEDGTSILRRSPASNLIILQYSFSNLLPPATSMMA